MDNFIDKLAQKFTATDMIKANTAAEAKEITQLKEKIEGYESLLQEMKLLNLKNIESAQKLEALVEESASKAADDSEQSAGKEYVDEIFDKTSEVIHKENVKVYRNVQATVQASLEDQTKSILEAQELAAKKSGTGFLKVMSVLIFIAVLADIALKVLPMLGIL